jgi:hypothetical protein
MSRPGREPQGSQCKEPTGDQPIPEEYPGDTSSVTCNSSQLGLKQARILGENK